MSATRKISWSAAMHELAADRTRPSAIREEPLRATSRGPHRLTAWRGENGQRYVVSIVPFDQAAAFCAPTSVAIAVRREANGIATRIDVRALGNPAADLDWIATCRAQSGATELHICTLCETAGHARAAACNLTPSAPARAAA